MSEKSQVTNKIIEHCKNDPDYFIRKIHCDGSQGRGLPDLWGTYKGMFICCESKVAGGRVSKMQEHIISLINKAGGCAFVATSLDEFIEQTQKCYSKMTGDRNENLHSR